ncbi:DEAD/DEAH box helicase [Sporichthya polymorpha]|uniref:DEAD/DEAH box helicase n=1 Tax=Sporichthya polymorpha TaxID=35751 RepID=UPI00036F0CC3|nr:DEAD/DEAH box helicase [Sporichthya polymorpha]
MPAALFTLDVASLRAVVGMATFQRGVEYADRGAVEQLTWSKAARVVLGSVAGGSTTPYVTTVHVFPYDSGGPYVFIRGECSCPVHFNCKHAAALALVAGGHAAPPSPKPSPPKEPTWEDRWRSALDPAAPSPVQIEPRTLAIELTLKRRLPNRWGGGDAMQSEPVELWARIVREGKKGWVAGELSWGRLGSLTNRTAYPEDQVRVLHDLHALYRARTGAGYAEHLRYGDERSIELSAVTSSALLPLLRQAVRAGLRLIHPDLGDLPPIETADLCLDVTAASDDTDTDAAAGLEVTPVLRTETGFGELTPIAFLGSGSGALVRSRDDEDGLPGNPADWPIRLVELSTPAALPLRRMVFAVEPLAVPAAHRDRFTDEYLPQLRRIAEVVSSDGSFTVPEVSPPELVLRADFGDDHALALSWHWSYRVGDEDRRLTVNSPEGAAFRDPQAEAALMSGLDPDLSAYGLGRPDGPGVDAPLELSGVDTMHFATEWLPRLSERDDLRVEVGGTPVEYREAGDSLRIAVSTQALENDGDWYDLGVSVTVDGETVPFLQLFVALAQGRSHLLLPGGAYFSLEKPELIALRALIDEARRLADAPPGQLRISRYQTGLWEELAGLGDVSHQAPAWQAHVQALRRLDSIGSTPVPAGVHADLRHYQVEGFEWLAFLWEHRLGGILADDMGLGKTLQSLALIAHARATEPDAPPFLIVAPTSVVSNWAAEAARFTPGLRVETVTETAARSRRSKSAPLHEKAERADVIVTSYALLRIDAASYLERPWAGLLLDEAQFVKNRKAQVHRVARHIDAPFKLAITGTPLENSVMELWALLSVAAPGLFPHPEAFKEIYSVPIERNGDSDLLARLRRRIRPLVKRRTKEEVAPELPPKQEQVLSVQLDPKHRKIYDLTLQRERQKVLKLLDDLEGNRFEILRSLTLLRQLSLHPGLTDDEHLTVPSAKLDALLEHVQAVEGTGHRTLVFSQFTRLLDLVEARLDAEGIEHVRLDGTTRRRAEVIERFKTGSAPVFLISLKAGGFGLNLTEADYCFLMDPWWNPAAELQAVDRTHRIGQTRTVHVYRLIAANTIEERVLDLQARKAKLFARVVDGGEGEGFGRALSAEDIRGLFT